MPSNKHLHADIITIIIFLHEITKVYVKKIYVLQHRPLYY